MSAGASTCTQSSDALAVEACSALIQHRRDPGSVWLSVLAHGHIRHRLHWTHALVQAPPKEPALPGWQQKGRWLFARRKDSRDQRTQVVLGLSYAIRGRKERESSGVGGEPAITDRHEGGEDGCLQRVAQL